MIDWNFVASMAIWVVLGIIGVGGYKLWLKRTYGSHTYVAAWFWWFALTGPIAILALVSIAYKMKDDYPNGKGSSHRR